MKKTFLCFICLLAFLFGISCSSSEPEIPTVQTEHVTARPAKEGIYFEVKVPADGYIYTARVMMPYYDYLMVTSEGAGKNIYFLLPYVKQGVGYGFDFFLMKEEKAYDSFSNAVWHDNIFVKSEGGLGRLPSRYDYVYDYSNEKLTIRYLNVPNNTVVVPWVINAKKDDTQITLMYSESENKFVCDGNGISWTLTDSELTNLRNSCEANGVKIEDANFFGGDYLLDYNGFLLPMGGVGLKVPLIYFIGSSFNRDVLKSYLGHMGGPIPDPN